MSPIPRLRPYSGLALFSYGFRPFFLFGSAYAGAAILLWIPLFYGDIGLPTLFSPRDWHVHEMVYGYVPAVMTGFLLTAIPNWTGRLPLQGTPLLLLLVAWAAGRVAVSVSAAIGWLASATVDCAFLFLLTAAAGREIIAGRNWRNLKVLGPLAALSLGNVAFHLEAQLEGGAEYGVRVGIAVILVLVMLIGGRIVPSFTRNWLARREAGRLPAPVGRFDAIAVGISIVSLAAWTIWPSGSAIAAVLLISGLLQAIRLARWAGERTFPERLVLVLHVAYVFLPVGFLLTALGAAGMLPASAGLHAWMVGGAGLMTLAVMTRATLGHTGHELTATPATQTLYAAVFIAALARIAAVIEPAMGFALLHAAAFFWTAGFLGFTFIYGPLLCRPRRNRAEN